LPRTKSIIKSFDFNKSKPLGDFARLKSIKPNGKLSRTWCGVDNQDFLG